MACLRFLSRLAKKTPPFITSSTANPIKIISNPAILSTKTLIQSPTTTLPSDRLFPCSPHAFLLPPMVTGDDYAPTGDISGEMYGDVDGTSVTTEVWADSVKKKRKRKMNKHKLRKLRRRLRRQT